jgi:type VI protein secretion system component VasK
VVQDTVLTKPDAPMLRSGSAICSWGEFMVVLDDLREDDSDLYKTIAARQRKLSRLASLALDEYEDSSNVSATVDKDEDEDEHGFSAAERRVAVLEAELAVALAMKPNSKKSLNYTKAIAALSTTLLGLPVGNVRDLRHDYWSEDTSNLRSLQTVLRRTKQHSVTDPRDKIHGLLGMMSDSSLNVDYNKSVSQVYCEATNVGCS